MKGSVPAVFGRVRHCHVQTPSKKASGAHISSASKETDHLESIWNMEGGSKLRKYDPKRQNASAPCPPSIAIDPFSNHERPRYSSLCAVPSHGHYEAKEHVEASTPSVLKPQAPPMFHNFFFIAGAGSAESPAGRWTGRGIFGGRCQVVERERERAERCLIWVWGWALEQP